MLVYPTSYKQLRIIAKEKVEANILKGGSLSGMFPDDAVDLVAGPVLSYYDINIGAIYFVLPRTGGVFILRMRKGKLLVELVGRLPKPNPGIKGFFATFEEEGAGHCLFLYDSDGVYELCPSLSKLEPYYEKAVDIVSFI